MIYRGLSTAAFVVGVSFSTVSFASPESDKCDLVFNEYSALLEELHGRKVIYNTCADSSPVYCSAEYQRMINLERDWGSRAANDSKRREHRKAFYEYHTCRLNTHPIACSAEYGVYSKSYERLYQYFEAKVKPVIEICNFEIVVGN